MPFRQLVTEVLAEVSAFDSRMLRTVGPFLSRPGWLTAEYNAGRRVRYVPPLRLYIFFSFVAFLTVALADVRMVKSVTVSSADLLKLLYIRHGIFYIRHLTFSAYHHAFVFFVMWVVVLVALAGIPESWKEPLMALAFAVMAVYTFLSLRRVYGQSHVKTLVKMILLSGSYMVLLLAGMLATLFISVLSL